MLSKSDSTSRVHEQKAKNNTYSQSAPDLQLWEENVPNECQIILMVISKDSEKKI